MDMGLLEVARDALKEIPLADILRERISLALDQLADAERQITSLQKENGKLQGQLETELLNHQTTRKTLQQLQDEHAEDVRIHRVIEFRRGKRTGGEWTAFCPKCHMPALEYPDESGAECSAACGWMAPVRRSIRSIVEEL